MEDILRVHIINGTGNLFENGDDIPLRKVHFALALGYDVGQSPSIRVLHFNEQCIILDEASQIADYIGMVQLGEHIHLIHGQISAGWGQFTEIYLLKNNLVAVRLAAVEDGDSKGSLTHHSHFLIVSQLGSYYSQGVLPRDLKLQEVLLLAGRRALTFAAGHGLGQRGTSRSSGAVSDGEHCGQYPGAGGGLPRRDLAQRQLQR